MPFAVPITPAAQANGEDFFSWPCVAGEDYPPTFGGGAAYARHNGMSVVRVTGSGQYARWGAYQARGPVFDRDAAMVLSVWVAVVPSDNSFVFGFGEDNGLVGSVPGAVDAYIDNVARTIQLRWRDAGLAPKVSAAVPLGESRTPGGAWFKIGLRYHETSGAVLYLDGAEVARVAGPIAAPRTGDYLRALGYARVTRVSATWAEAL